jgi:hypothetical protein
VALTTQEFAIDPHVFQDDGTRWLFYATDFLTHTHVGTGTVRDRMLDPFTLAGNPVPVVRAQHDWHLFDPNRLEKGGARWHTIEGPTVLRHKGVFYEMFSGGNWKTESYGVGYATSDRIDTKHEWKQACDGTQVLPVLRSSGGVLGPGHNSVIRGPDNRRLYCVYHRWDRGIGRRRMAIDLLEWVGPELVVFGPTNTAQSAPNFPCSRWPGSSSEAGQWNCASGNWIFERDRVVQMTAQGYCEMQNATNIETGFVVECDALPLRGAVAGSMGLYVSDHSGQRIWVSLTPDGRWQRASSQPKSAHDETVSAPPETDFAMKSRLVHLTASGRTLYMDSTESPGTRHRTVFAESMEHIGLFTNGLAGEFPSFALTRGWEDTFEHPDDNVTDLGYETSDDGWSIESMSLGRHDRAAGSMLKRAPDGLIEFVINARLEYSQGQNTYGVFPAAEKQKPGTVIALSSRDGRGVLVIDDSGGEQLDSAPVLAVLPPSFDARIYQQFGFTLNGAGVSIRWRGTPLCDARLSARGSRVGLYARGPASFDLVRVTELIHGER